MRWSEYAVLEQLVGVLVKIGTTNLRRNLNPEVMYGGSIYSIGSWPWLTEVWPRSWRGEEAENEEEEEEDKGGGHKGN